MLDKNHPIDFKNSKFILNSKNKNFLELIESVFISKILCHNIAACKIKTITAIVDTICKLYPHIKNIIPVTN